MKYIVAVLILHTFLMGYLLYAGAHMDSHVNNNGFIIKHIHPDVVGKEIHLYHAGREGK